MIASAASVDFHQLTTAYNAVYSDYPFSVQITPQNLRIIFSQTQVDLSASLLCIEDGEIIGFGFLGICNVHGWVTSVGVLPSRRREGIGRRIMQGLIQVARERGIISLQLEVDEHNDPALVLYQRLGFTTRRRIFTLDGEDRPADSTDAHGVDTTQVEHALRLHDACHPVIPPWKRQLFSLDQLRHSRRAWMVDSAAYAIGYTWDGLIYLDDLGFVPGGEAAFRHLMTHLPPKDDLVRVYNLAEDEPTWDILQDMGYEVGITQYEMMLNLAAE